MSKKMIAMTFISALILSLNPLSETHSSAQTIEVPDGTIAITVFKFDKEDGSISTVFLDREGNEVPQCLVCTLERERILQQRFRVSCEEATQKGIEIDGKRMCHSLTNVTLKQFNSLDTVFTNHNLFFTRILPGNVAQEIPIRHSH